MEIEWQSAFETGNESVDLQHRFFINLINRIGDNFRNSTDDEFKHKLIIELKKYADFHFTSEENIATSLSLPGVDRHHDRHMELFDEFNHYSEGLENGTKSFDEFLQFLIQWFSGHTYYEDQKLFRHNL